MNKVYRLVWSTAKNLWVVAAELVSGNGGPPPVAAASRRTLEKPDRSLPLSSFIMALEPRFMFDAAGAATAAVVDRPVDGTLRYAAYRPETTDAGIAAYRLKADFAARVKPPRIGLSGTARIYGKKVSLGYYLLRRPLTALRQRLGW